MIEDFVKGQIYRYSYLILYSVSPKQHPRKGVPSSVTDLSIY